MPTTNLRKRSLTKPRAKFIPKSEFAQQIISKLEELYPVANSELVFDGPYQLIVSVVLSAQCTDKKVNQVTPTLFAQFPDFCALAKAKLSTIERIIRPINYYRTKARHLIELAKEVQTKHSGKVPTDRNELIALPGVGNKTASVVQSELGVPALPVDTHIFRVANRLGLTEGKTPDQVSDDLRQIFPSEQWRGLHHRLIFLGRRICAARKPLCAQCVLSKVCRTGSELVNVST